MGFEYFCLSSVKLLEVQQQLAVAVSAERKKDAMIEQLDKVCEILNAFVRSNDLVNK